MTPAPRRGRQGILDENIARVNVSKVSSGVSWPSPGVKGTVRVTIIVPTRDNLISRSPQFARRDSHPALRVKRGCNKYLCHLLLPYKLRKATRPAPPASPVPDWKHGPHRVRALVPFQNCYRCRHLFISTMTCFVFSYNPSSPAQSLSHR